MPADLIVLHMLDVNVIPGVNWLVKYHDVIDCYNQVVKLSLPYGNAFMYRLEAQKPLIYRLMSYGIGLH